MKVNKFSKFLLSWLLALVMVLGLFVTPVQASVNVDPGGGDDTVTITGKYSLEYQAYTDGLSTVFKSFYHGILSSDYRLFLFRSGSDDYTKNPSRRYYSVGAVLGNGSVVNVPDDWDADEDGARDVFVDYGRRITYYYSDGHVGSDVIYDAPTYSYFGKILVYSETDYLCNCYVFDSLANAASFFESGDTTGLVRQPDDMSDGEEVDDGEWRNSIIEIIESWFGGVLEILAEPLRALGEGVGSVIAAINNARDYIVAQLPKRLSNALSTYFSNLDNSLFDILGLIQDFFDFVNEKIEGIFEFVERIDLRINSLVTDVTAAIVAELPDPIKEGLKELFDYIGVKLDEVKVVADNIHAFMNGIHSGVVSVAEDLSTYIEKFFDFAALFIEGTFINHVTDAILAGFTTCMQPLEDLFVKLFIPDMTLLNAKIDLVRSKLGFIDDFKVAGEYILNFLKNLGGGSPPVITIDLGASTSRNLGNQTVTIDFSWYAPYKPTVDKLLAGIIWATFIWNVFKRLPDIIQGAGMISAGAATIDKSFSVRGDKSGGAK